MKGTRCRSRAFGLAVMILWMGATGCASGGTASSSDRSVITREDLVAFSGQTCMDAVRRLRPMWLQVRSVTVSGAHRPAVFLDGTPFGDMYALNQIMTAEVVELRYVTPADATTRFGTGYPGGAILVFTKAR